LPYVWRQAFANLYRPGNQTLILLITIGLGATFIGTLQFTRQTLVNRIALTGSDNQPNMVLFDIQTAHKEAVSQLAVKHGLPLIQQVPIVTLRIEEIRGKTVDEARGDTTAGIPLRAFES